MSKIGKEYIIGKPFTPIVTTLTYDELNNIKEDKSSIEISNAIIFSVPQDTNGDDIENEGSIWLTDNNGYLYSLTSTIKKLTSIDNSNNSNNTNNNSNNNDNNNNNSSNELIYYWYAGQTNPDEIDTINPIATDYVSGGGWYELGTSVPNTIQQLVKGADWNKYWYVMVPVTTGTTLKPVTSDMTTLDTSVSTLSTKVYNGVTYQIYWYGGATGARNTFRFAKK